jgi:cytochrome oxidase Cu insertion factor (SCO1/SenC/PrrC family)
MATTILTSSSAKSRIYLLVLMALFAVPMLLAWFLVEHWQPGASVQHGELLDPIQPVAHFQAQLLAGDELDTTFLKKHWTLIYINTENTCNNICRSRLNDIRQIRLALGKDMGRVQTLLLQTGMPDAEFETWLLKEHPAMTKAVSDAITPGFFQKVFKTPSRRETWVYLVDPLSNLVMRYGPEVTSKGILEDLKRLLKYSNIG